MIVIFLIGIISSVIGYNVKGSLEKGKAFKSKQGKEKLEAILNLQTSAGWSVDEICTNESYLKECLKDSGMIKDVDKAVKDGWNLPYTFRTVKDQVVVNSDKLHEYEKAHPNI